MRVQFTMKATAYTYRSDRTTTIYQVVTRVDAVNVRQTRAVFKEGVIPDIQHRNFYEGTFINIPLSCEPLGQALVTVDQEMDTEFPRYCLTFDFIRNLLTLQYESEPEGMNGFKDLVHNYVQMAHI